MLAIGKKFRDIGFLILRVGIGAMFIFHGFPKMTGGPTKWAELGKAISVFGITFAPTFWGFMAAFSELFGGLALIVGFLVRPFCVLLVITMLVASAMHVQAGLADGRALDQALATAAPAIEMGIVFLSLFFLGAGKYSLAAYLKGRKAKAAN